MRKYITEAIGAFFLVLTVCSVSLASSGVLGPLAVGSVLMVMVFAGGHISGGHYNPAVSLAVFLRGRLSVQDLGAYIGAQLLGGLVGAAIARYLTNVKPAHGISVSGRDIGAAFVAELLFAFALAFVVLNVATSQDHPNNSFYGLAIGFTVFVGAVAVGEVSGGAFNPAVGFGLCLAGVASWSMIWIYLLGPLVGGAVAAFVFRALNPDDVSRGAGDAPGGTRVSAARRR